MKKICSAAFLALTVTFMVPTAGAGASTVAQPTEVDISTPVVDITVQAEQPKKCAHCW